MIYPWFNHVWGQWCVVQRENRLPLASLLVVQEGMGDQQLTQLLARSLLCSSGPQPCGTCHSCRLMAKEAHPDFHRVEPEKSGKSITVEQIRQINLYAQESSQFGGDRVIVIRPADALNQSAANALLKTLEDSSGQCRFILVTAYADRILPTILSRCRKLVVPDPSHQEVAQWVEHETSEHIPPYILSLNGYAPLRVLEFTQQQRATDYHQLAETFCEFLEQPSTSVSKMTDLINQSPIEYLTWLWHLLSDAQKCQFQIKDKSFLPESAMIAQKVPYELLYQQYKALTDLLGQFTVQRGLNTELLTLGWLIKFDEVSCSSIPTAI